MSGFTEFRIKIKESSKVSHCLFLRQHRVREKTECKPTDRTIFVGNVAPFLDEDSLESLFSQFGKVTAVYLHQTPSPRLPDVDESPYFKGEKPKGHKVGYVVFENPMGMDKALENTSVGVVKISSQKNGFKKWVSEYNNRIPDTIGLQKDVDKYMANYDVWAESKSQEEKAATEADDEGWITVTKKSRKPGFERKESVMKKLSDKMEKRREKKELKNFYRFQIKESKMKNLVLLRQKFEEDKKRIAAMKATRRFKPF